MKRFGLLIAAVGVLALMGRPASAQSECQSAVECCRAGIETNCPDALPQTFGLCVAAWHVCDSNAADPACERVSTRLELACDFQGCREFVAEFCDDPLPSAVGKCQAWLNACFVNYNNNAGSEAQCDAKLDAFEAACNP